MGARRSVWNCVSHGVEPAAIDDLLSGAGDTVSPQSPELRRTRCLLRVNQSLGAVVQPADDANRTYILAVRRRAGFADAAFFDEMLDGDGRRALLATDRDAPPKSPCVVPLPLVRKRITELVSYRNDERPESDWVQIERALIAEAFAEDPPVGTQLTERAYSKEGQLGTSRLYTRRVSVLGRHYAISAIDEPHSLTTLVVHGPGERMGVIGEVWRLRPLAWLFAATE